MIVQSAKRFVLIVLLAVLFFMPTAAKTGTSTIKNVLIIHSYHQGLLWTDNISKGIESEFEDSAAAIELHYEYLDTKRYFSKEYYEQMVAFKQFKTLKHNIRYDLIICSDNNALTYINDYGPLLFPKTPVVFCGINNYTPRLLRGRKNITGVVEAIDYKANLDLIRKIHPDRKHIVVIIDKTPTGKAIKIEFERVAKDFIADFSFEFYQDFVLDDVQHRISQLGDADLIYILTFNRDRLGNFISYTDGIRMIRNASRVPIYGSWDFYFGNGIVGGMITSGFSQGQMAARMGKKILNGSPIEDIPVLTQSPNRYMFDFNEMAAFGIKRSQLPKGSRLINVPPAWYETYKRQIVLLLSFLMLSAAFLSWRLVVQHRRQRNLRKLNDELDKRVAEQTRKLEKKNHALSKEITERIKLEKEIRKLAATDPLTGVNNRRSFMEKANDEFLRSRRYGHKLSVLMMDIDHFKDINDTYGHHMGDVSLQTFTTVCMKTLRKQDFCGRLGGEEFAVILIETDEESALLVAERLRLLVAQTVVTQGAIQLQFHVSIGVTQISEKDRHIEDTIHRADKGLYMAKDEGRNRVVSI